MTLSSFEWIVVAGAFGLAIAVISYFLKRTMSRTDSHDTDINEIKRTYVTKDELKEIKAELRDETRVLAADVSEIKKNYLTKDDFITRQAETERKLDRIFDFLLKERGGNGNG